MDKELIDLKKEFLQYLDDSEMSIKRETQDVQIYEIIDTNAQDIYKWLLGRVILQIKSFGKII